MKFYSNIKAVTQPDKLIPDRMSCNILMTLKSRYFVDIHWNPQSNEQIEELVLQCKHCAPTICKQHDKTNASFHWDALFLTNESEPLSVEVCAHHWPHQLSDIKISKLRCINEKLKHSFIIQPVLYMWHYPCLTL